MDTSAAHDSERVCECVRRMTLLSVVCPLCEGVRSKCVPDVHSFIKTIRARIVPARHKRFYLSIAARANERVRLRSHNTYAHMYAYHTNARSSRVGRNTVSFPFSSKQSPLLFEVVEDEHVIERSR